MRRCALVFAGAGAALAALAPLSTTATPFFAVAVSISCPSGAICDGNTELAPGLHSITAFVACSVEDLPTLQGKVFATAVRCLLQGATDGIRYVDDSDVTPGIEPAEAHRVLSNLPLQSYQLCVIGQYLLNDANHTPVTSSSICNTASAPLA
jgi:hypothetical protein